MSVMVVKKNDSVRVSEGSIDKLFNTILIELSKLGSVNFDKINIEIVPQADAAYNTKTNAQALDSLGAWDSNRKY